MIKIHRDKCSSKCDLCVKACPVEALEKKKNVTFNSDRCIECWSCIQACKNDAIYLKEDD